MRAVALGGVAPHTPQRAVCGRSVCMRAGWSCSLQAFCLHAGGAHGAAAIRGKKRKGVVTFATAPREK